MGRGCVLCCVLRIDLPDDGAERAYTLERTTSSAIAQRAKADPHSRDVNDGNEKPRPLPWPYRLSNGIYCWYSFGTELR